MNVNDREKAICRLLSDSAPRSVGQIAEALRMDHQDAYDSCCELNRRQLIFSWTGGVPPFLTFDMPEQTAAAWLATNPPGIACKICGSATRPLWHNWHRCTACGSDSAENNYASVKHHYMSEDSLFHTLRQHGNCRNRLIESMRTNLEWFTRFSSPEKTFLDIGSHEGCGMMGMERLGWQAWGFDVFGEIGDRVEVGDVFAANLFDRRFGAVMCRETIEHADDWRGLIREAHKALLPSGLFQIQTPRPQLEYHEAIYQNESNQVHLHIISPGSLCSELERAGFYVLGSILWTEGQAWMCRRLP